MRPLVSISGYPTSLTPSAIVPGPRAPGVKHLPETANCGSRTPRSVRGFWTVRNAQLDQS